MYKQAALCKKGCHTRRYNTVIHAVIHTLLYTLRIRGLVQTMFGKISVIVTLTY